MRGRMAIDGASGFHYGPTPPCYLLSRRRPISLPNVGASELFVAVEYLFDNTYAVGKEPTTGVVRSGAPLLFHGGIRFRF